MLHVELLLVAENAIDCLSPSSNTLSETNGSVMFHVVKQVWNVISFAVTYFFFSSKVVFLDIFLSIFRLFEVCNYNQVLVMAERVLVA